MTTTPPPNHQTPDDLSPHPGGTLRFLITLLIALLILGGVVVGMIAWMQATSPDQVQGPGQLKFPEHRYYRR
jgi:hypothetical protein